MTLTFEGHVPLNQNLSLYVQQFGQSANDLVFVHGGPDWDHSYFLPFVLPLADKFRLTFFDLRGCGLSTKFKDPNQYSLKHAAKDLGQLIQVLGLKKPAVLGFSYGGRVLMEYLSSTPCEIRAAVLASTTAYTDFQNVLNEWEEYKIRKSSETKEKMNLIFSDKNPDVEKSRQLALLTSSLDIWKLEKVEEYISVLNQIKFSDEWMNAWQSGALKPAPTDYEKVLLNLKCPVLILHGEKDMRFPLVVARRLQAQLSNSILQVLSDSGHMAHIESPQEWTQRVQNFLETVFD